MLNDRELLEAAAKAAGYPVTDEMRALWLYPKSSAWNPLTDDGDALRLAVKLRLDVHFEMNGLMMETPIVEVMDCAECMEVGSAFCAMQDCSGDPAAATRRAIVRAAAAAAMAVG